MLTLIDALEIAPRHYRGKNDMKEYEFFECDWCGTICRMDIQFYKKECEPHIYSDTKYRCRECYDRMENRRPGRPKKEQTEAVTPVEHKDNVRIQEDKQEDNEPDHLLEVTQKVIDVVNQPPHYTVGGIETIDFIKSRLTPEQYEGYLYGNALKYISRYPHKNGVEDLLKSEWFIKRLIRELSK